MLPRLPTETWVLQEMQPHRFSGVCLLNRCRMTLRTMWQYFFSKNGNIPSLMLLKEYYLFRFSYENGVVKKRAREAENSPQYPRIRPGKVVKATLSPLLWNPQSSGTLGPHPSRVQTTETAAEGSTGDPVQSKPRQPVCRVAALYF